MKLLSLFSGIGAFEEALKNIKVNYELVGFSEIDKYAIKSYCAIHNESEEKNLGDITKIDMTRLPKDIDIITHGSPCQDFSIAGKQAGGDLGTGTRSSLMWNTINIVTYCKPKYVIWENVKNLLSKKHKHNFDNYLTIMESLGYKNYYQVLNAKDYGIPQNRERVYTVSIRKDIDKSNFKFPEKEELKLRLKDILEDEVDEKYYLSKQQIRNFIVNNNGNCNPSGKGMNGKFYFGSISPTLTTNKGEGIKFCIKVTREYGIFDTKKSKHQAGSVYDKEGLAPTLDSMQGGWRQPCIEIKNATKKGYMEAIEGDSINLSYPTSNTRRGRVEKGVSQTLQCNDMIGVINPQMRIRKLTPKECWRLMGFSDEDFEKAVNIPTSNTQLYKQAGNSIVVNVLEKIFKNLFGEENEQI